MANTLVSCCIDYCNLLLVCITKSNLLKVKSVNSKVTIRLGFPGHILFLGPCKGDRLVFKKLMVCPGFVLLPVHIGHRFTILCECACVNFFKYKILGSIVIGTLSTILLFVICVLFANTFSILVIGLSAATKAIGTLSYMICIVQVIVKRSMVQVNKTSC